MVTLYCQSHTSLLFTTVCGHCLLPIIYLIIIHYCLWSLSIANHMPHYYSLLFVVTVYCQSYTSILLTTVCGHCLLSITYLINMTTVYGHCLLPIIYLIIIHYCLWSLSIANHIPHYYSLLFVVTLYCQSHASLLFTTVCGHSLLPITYLIIIHYCLWSLSIANHMPHYYSLLFVVTVYCQSYTSILLTTVCGHCLLSITYLINMTTVYGHCLLPIIYLIIIHYCLWSLSIANHIPHYYSLLFVVTVYCQSHASLLFTTVCGHCLLPIIYLNIIDYCLWSLSIVNHIPN